MTEPAWPIDDNPAPQDITFLDNRIYEYNAATTGYHDGRLLAIVLRDERQEILAGIYGWTWGGCLWVDLLWVRDDRRHQGYGAQLLQAVEQEAIIRGCEWAMLDTHSFQAPDFYQQHGYEIAGTLEDYPKGYKKYYLRKRLG